MDIEEVTRLSHLEISAAKGSIHYVDGISGSRNWKERIDLVKICEDNKYIPRHENAGGFIDDTLCMHNGIRIHKNSYYGYSMLKMLMENKGVHEPQEERAFQEVLTYVEKNSSMLELGAYWGFYSMWFKKNTKGNTILVEPDVKNFELGKINFKLNNMEGIFHNKFVNSFFDEKNISVDKIFEIEKIDKLAICHSDIQGYELEMLKGSIKSIDKIDYFFISTHDNNLHYSCIDFLKQHKFQILCSADMNESYSYDGLIVAKNCLINGPSSLSISKRK